MATISGKDGTVSAGGAILDCTGWSVTRTANISVYGSCDTAGVKNRVAGVKDTTGSYEAKYNGQISVDAGDSVTGTFTLDGAATYSLDIVIEQYQLEVDMDDGEVVGYSVDWGGNGALTIS